VLPSHYFGGFGDVCAGSDERISISYVLKIYVARKPRERKSSVIGCFADYIFEDLHQMISAVLGRYLESVLGKITPPQFRSFGCSAFRQYHVPSPTIDRDVAWTACSDGGEDIE
jgi:hypothetical protein